MKRNKGFTLIELLVVIAIIGILSSVVLASLTTARSKGGDAAIQSQMSSLRSQAELYYSTTGSSTYGAAGLGCGVNMFSSSTAVANNTGKILDGIYAAGPSTAPACVSNSSSWVVATGLKTAGTFFCVDSSGNGIATTSASLTATMTACK